MHSYKDKKGVSVFMNYCVWGVKSKVLLKIDTNSEGGFHYENEKLLSAIISAVASFTLIIPYNSIATLMYMKL